MSGGEIIIFVLIAAAVIIGAIYSNAAARNRRLELAALALRLGFDFRPDKNPAFATGWSFLGKLNRGSDRYASNILEGQHGGHRVLVFDYHYQTGSGKNRRDHDLTFSILILQGASFPQVTIGPESLFDKIAETFGFGDIQFESAEFSNAFKVQSNDKKCAYDVCNPRMIEFLLANRDLDMEIQGPALVLAFNPRLSAVQIEINLERLVQIRSLLPEYLFTKG